MRVLFRADASRIIGTGHIMRCLNLARELAELGAVCVFVCAPHEDHLKPLIEKRGFKVFLLPVLSLKNLISRTDHNTWLGNTQDYDSQFTLEIINKEKIDIVVVDQYGIDQIWETKIKPFISVLVCVDDLINRKHHCDILLNQNIIYDISGEDKDIDRNKPLFLKGPAFCLLDHFFRIQKQKNTIDSSEKRIFVYFGGSDPFDLTNRVIDYAISSSDHSLIFDIIQPRSSPNQGAIEIKASNRSHINLHSNLPSLSKIMQHADYAIGAAGVNSWERICLGLPSINIITAENQIHIAQQQEHLGLAKNLGNAAKLREVDLHHALNQLINGQIKLNERNSRKLKLDGFGAARAASAIRFVFSGHLHICKEIRSADRQEHEKQKVGQNSGRSPTFYFELRVGELLCTVRFIRQQENNSFTYSLQENEITLSDDAKKKVLASSLKKFWEEKKDGFVSFSPSHSLSNIEPENIKTIAILSDEDSWINCHIERLVAELLELGYNVNWAYDHSTEITGDVRFLLSYSKLLTDESLEKFKYNLVIHESDLPKGRGWSPMSWQIRRGESQITFSMIFAETCVDSGNIIAQKQYRLDGSELSDNWRLIQGQITTELCLKFINEYPSILNHQRKQSGVGSYFRKLTPLDSELNLRQTIDEQFDVLRTVDNEKYPAYFVKNGQKFLIKIMKEKI